MFKAMVRINHLVTKSAYVFESSNDVMEAARGRIMEAYQERWERNVSRS